MIPTVDVATNLLLIVMVILFYLQVARAAAKSSRSVYLLCAGFA